MTGIRCPVEQQWIVAPRREPGGDGIRWEEICALPCIIHLLKARGLGSAEEVRAFLHPRLGGLRDPFALGGMTAAVDRILQAIDRSECVVLYGDYDVDGVTSLALLGDVLEAYGGTVKRFLPWRMSEGYGLSTEGLERCCREQGPDLLIAVDCGTSSVAEIAALAGRGIDIIVVDHHEPKGETPACVALVNPRVHGNTEAFPLCSVALCFKVCHALLKRRPLPGFDLRDHLDLVALGTVADIVPLESENRILVARGSLRIARSGRPGLRRLMAVAGVKSAVTPIDIGYRLGPRLNAAGRLSTAEQALRLLTTQDDQEAAELARALDQQNRERQEVEKRIYQEAEEMAIASLDDTVPAIVLGAEGWHPGVLGIVAGRLVRKFHRPAIVIGFDETGLGKGSGRSIEGFSLVTALGECAGLLEKYGGHAMAAGVALRRERLEEFRASFLAAAGRRLTPDDLRPKLRIDYEVTLGEIDHDFFRWHEALQPFGSGNPQPLFLARGVEPAVPPRVVGERHFSLRLRQQGRSHRAIFFDGAQEPLPPPPWDVAFRLQSDEYEGLLRLQLQVQAIRRTTFA